MISDRRARIPINLGRHTAPSPRWHAASLRKLAPESMALAWREISRFNPSARRGYSGKVVGAALLAVKRFDCGATVAVTDRDRETGRQAELQEGADRAERLFPGCPAIWGLAIESVEAWTLAMPDEIAEELGVDVTLVQNEYPRGVDVESLSERSGKLEHRPKQTSPSRRSTEAPRGLDRVP